MVESLAMRVENRVLTLSSRLALPWVAQWRRQHGDPVALPGRSWDAPQLLESGIQYIPLLQLPELFCLMAR
jgi:hypothetical protein